MEVVRGFDDEIETTPLPAKTLLRDDIYNKIVGYIKNLDIQSLTMWLNDERAVRECLIGFPSPSSDHKTDFFTLFRDTQIDKNHVNPLRTMLLAVEDKDLPVLVDHDEPAGAGNSEAIIQMVNFLLTAPTQRYRNNTGIGGVWAYTLVQLNSLDNVDGKSTVHALAAVGITKKHMDAFLRACKLAGCLPDLSIPAKDGRYPIEIAIQSVNIGFLAHYGKCHDFRILDEKASAEPNDEFRKFRQDMHAKLLRLEDILDEAIASAKP